MRVRCFDDTSGFLSFINRDVMLLSIYLCWSKTILVTDLIFQTSPFFVTENITEFLVRQGMFNNLCLKTGKIFFALTFFLTPALSGNGYFILFVSFTSLINNGFSFIKKDDLSVNFFERYLLSIGRITFFSGTTITTSVHVS